MANPKIIKDLPSAPSLYLFLLTKHQLRLPFLETALRTHHPGLMKNISTEVLHGITLAGMAIAKAAAPHNHLIDGIVVLLKGITVPPPKQSISKGVEFSKIDP